MEALPFGLLINTDVWYFLHIVQPLLGIKSEISLIRNFKFMALSVSLCNLSVHICIVALINALENYNRISVVLHFRPTWIPKQFSMIHVPAMSTKNNNSDYVTFDKVLPNI